MPTKETRALSSLDLAFFMLESEVRMCNIGPLAIIRPPQGTRSVKAYADKLMQQMKKRPVGSPFNLRYCAAAGLGMPYLETAPSVDLDDHCHRLTLDDADEATLHEAVCRLHEERLDRRRPLWAFYIIDGLQNGRVALYAKVHHGVIDGKTFVDVCTHWASANGTEKTVRAFWEGAPPKPPKAQKHPTASDAGAFLGLPQSAQELARMATSAYQKVSRPVASVGRILTGLGLPFVATPSVFRATPSVHRVLGVCALPLETLKAIGKARGASINDLLLVLVDMALTRYLADKGRPENSAPLVVDMPIALSSAKGGNQVAILQFPMGTPQATPLGRLAQIRKRTAKVKEGLKDADTGALLMYSAAVHGLPALMEMAGFARVPMVANLVVSNPFGLPERRWIGGAEVESMIPLNLLGPGLALNATAATYHDRLQICYMGLESEVPDLQLMADYTVEALDQLQRFVDDAMGKRPQTLG